MAYRIGWSCSVWHVAGFLQCLHAQGIRGIWRNLCVMLIIRKNDTNPPAFLCSKPLNKPGVISLEHLKFKTEKQTEMKDDPLESQN